MVGKNGLSTKGIEGRKKKLRKLFLQYRNLGAPSTYKKQETVPTEV